VFASPQGIVFLPGERSLLVADYTGGINSIDVATGARRPLAEPAHASLFGIDGMVRDGDSLIVTQNGILPHRVTRFRLDARGEPPTGAETLERNTPAFSEPTLGTVAGDDYYFVANSQWGMFDEDGKLPEASKLAPPLIMKIPLRPSPPPRR